MTDPPHEYFDDHREQNPGADSAGDVVRSDSVTGVGGAEDRAARSSLTRDQNDRLYAKLLGNETDSKPKPGLEEPTFEESVRETFEAIVTAFLLAFIFRAFVIEAFVIPTGSMAPTLLGEHYRLDCEMCGYEFVIGVAPDEHIYDDETPCPMCDYEIPLRELNPDGGERFTTNGKLLSGDRILVLKYLYEFMEPHRWDVVVFKNPSKTDEFDENYIKRLVGLPNEQIWLVDGDVYARPAVTGGEAESGHPDEGAPWEIQRKPARVQRAVWQPIHLSDYYPLDAESRAWQSPWVAEGAGWAFSGIGPRWSFGSAEGGAAGDGDGVAADAVDGGDDASGEDTGVLAYRFRNRPVMHWPYNRFMSNEGDEQGPIDLGELAVAATVTPGGNETGVELQISDTNQLMRAVIESDGGARIEWRNLDDDEDASWRELAGAEIAPLREGQPHRVEFWNVDKALWLWVNGEAVIHHEQFVPDVHEIAAAGYRRKPQPIVRIVVHGPATVRSADLWRDLYYTQAGTARYWPESTPDERAPLGTVNHPAIIEPDEFFVLGDNSPWSGDSRRWSEVNPWIAALTNVGPGFVPRKMMLGRAFFVYFPARFDATGTDSNVIPNFADMRFIR